MARKPPDGKRQKNKDGRGLHEELQVVGHDQREETAEHSVEDDNDSARKDGGLDADAHLGGEKKRGGQDLDGIFEDLGRNGGPGEELTDEKALALLEEFDGGDDAGSAPAHGKQVAAKHAGDTPVQKRTMATPP